MNRKLYLLSLLSNHSVIVLFQNVVEFTIRMSTYLWHLFSLHNRTDSFLGEITSYTENLSVVLWYSRLLEPLHKCLDWEIYRERFRLTVGSFSKSTWTWLALPLSASGIWISLRPHKVACSNESTLCKVFSKAFPVSLQRYELSIFAKISDLPCVTNNQNLSQFDCTHLFFEPSKKSCKKALWSSLSLS